MQGLFGSCNWNEYNLNHLTRNNWRASLVPAAAVIPAPIAYIKVVAVKKLVVEPSSRPGGPASSCGCVLLEPARALVQPNSLGLTVRCSRRGRLHFSWRRGLLLTGRPVCS